MEFSQEEERSLMRSEIIRLKAALFQEQVRVMRLNEQIAVLKRAHEINEKQIRDYERDQVNVKKPEPMFRVKPLQPDGRNGWMPQYGGSRFDNLID